MKKTNFEIVILISSDTEWKCVRDLYPALMFERSPFGEMFVESIGNTEILFFQSGWGKVTAAASTQYAIDHYHPKILFNMGTCGGFKGRSEVGEVILVSKTIIYDIIEQMSDPQQAIDFYTTEVDLGWLPPSSFSTAMREQIISADRDIVIREIPELIEKYVSRVADWESGAIAWVADRNAQKLLILRAISDLVGEDGGEVYADMDRYEDRTRMVMKKLIGLVVEFLDSDRSTG